MDQSRSDDGDHDEAVDAESDDPRLRAAWDAYRLGAGAVGEGHARAFARARPEHGEGWYALACALERQGRLGEADRCFRRAALARVCPRPAPYRCPWRRFAQLVDDARAALKPALRTAFDEVALVLADYAEPDLIADHADAEILGLFVGAERGDRDGGEPAQIFIFRRAHEHACREAEEFADELKRTVWHEFGHYLGYGEDGIAQLGLA